ncbi:MAG: tripartite tricarboxylate transporter permease, partial [Bradyrhizobium sp.]
MDIFHNLAIGFEAAFSLTNLGFCLLGVILGTLIGVLPGIGPLATIAMLLPITFELNALTALIMLAGIYYGAQYGGSTTAILVNLPGESSSVVTCLDGYQMARQGRAGSALAIAAIGSFFAGCAGTLFIAAFAPLLAAVSQRFQSPEYFALMLFGLVAAVVLAHGSVTKALAMILLGLSFGLVGTDVTGGTVRFTFGVPELFDGIDFVAVAMGLFGLAEILRNLEQKDQQRQISAIGTLWPTSRELRQAWPAILRGTMLGSFLGILPGGGSILSSFASYTLEKKIAKEPSRFGNGAIEGVAGPESANNAGAQTSFIPLLTLGIPSNPIMALLMGAMIIKGIAPGTAVMTKEPVLFWGMIASMWIGNLMLIIINLPLIGLWVKLLSIPYRLLFPCILIFCCVGVYSIGSSSVAVVLT